MTKVFNVSEDKQIYSISQLNHKARLLLEQNFHHIWVSGEISNCAKPSSGHIYFTLKDNDAQIRCAFFRNRNSRIKFRIEDGIQVLAQAKLSLYEGRGDYQLIIESLEPAGSGALQRAFEELKEKLQKRGWFDPSLKKDLPAVPNQIGIISSATGAALHDILTTLKRRFATVPVIIYPTQVQGKTAAPNITAQINLANQRAECDLLILSRGGGSLEDLWPFNEETVAEAIFKSDIPIISAVGHEVDFTIADFVADVRAATPTAAAELATPNAEEWIQRYNYFQIRFIQHIKQIIDNTQQHLSHLSKRLQHPGTRIREQAQRLDELEIRLLSSLKHQLQIKVLAFSKSQHRLEQQNPLTQIHAMQMQFQHEFDQLISAVTLFLHEKRAALHKNVCHLETLNPLATLKRGYSIVKEKKSSQIITKCSELASGDRVMMTFEDGEVESEVV